RTGLDKAIEAEHFPGVGCRRDSADPIQRGCPADVASWPATVPGLVRQPGWTCWPQPPRTASSGILRWAIVERVAPWDFDWWCHSMHWCGSIRGGGRCAYLLLVRCLKGVLKATMERRVERAARGLQ